MPHDCSNFPISNVMNSYHLQRSLLLWLFIPHEALEQ